MNRNTDAKPVHPIIDIAVNGFLKSPEHTYALSLEAKSALTLVLGRMSGQTKAAAIRELAMFAYMLDANMGMSHVASTLFEITESAGAVV